MKYIALTLSIVAMVLSGCVKQHPNQDEQGLRASVKVGRAIDVKSIQGMYVVNTNTAGNVSPTSVERPVLEHFDYGGQYNAQTFGEPTPAGMSLAGDVVIDSDLDAIRYLNKVQFNTDAPLLTKFTDVVDFLGEPNKTYKIKYKLTPNRLVVMKLVSKKEISHYEMPYADYLGDDTYAVPLGGYAINPQKKTKILNNDNDPTNQFRLVDAEMQFNEDGSLKTNCRTCADYITLNPDSFVKFNRIENKKDVYPSEYFNGEWYFSESVVDSQPGMETAIGQIYGAYDLNFRPASKIKFFRTAGTLKGYNIAIDEELSTENTLNLTPVISFPAMGRNYKIAETGSMAQLQEITIDDTNLESAPYIDISFENISTLRTRLESMFNPLVGFGNTATGALKQVKFANNSFSFTLEDVASGRLWKYSFLRADDRGYTPRRHYKRDREQFGFFTANRTRIPRPEQDYREEDFEKNVLIQRHNPEKDIVFYFSSLTPKDLNGRCRQTGDLSLKDMVDTDFNINYREIGRRSVQYWDAAFQAAGAKSRVVLKEVDANGDCFDAPLGDLEFHTLNLIDSIQSSNLLGVGPSLIDPYSGEVVNTTMNVHLAPFRSIISSEVRTFIKSRLGVFTDSSNRLDANIVTNSTILGETVSAGNPYNLMGRLLPEKLKKFIASQYHFGHFMKDLNVNNLPKLAALNGYGPLDPVNMFEAGNFNANSLEMKKLQLVSDHIATNDRLVSGDRINVGPIESYKDAFDRAQFVQKYRPEFFNRYFSAENSALATMNNLTKDIETRCPEVLEFVQMKKAATAQGQVPSVTSAEEYPVVRKCMARLIPEKVMATIVHELGHNLGLRHNFFASSDKKNFFTKAEVKQLYNIDVASDNDLPKSSSVMDYVPSDKDRLFYPGHYDIAAIRYGYANKVELESTGAANSGTLVELNNGVIDTSPGAQGSIQENAQANRWKIRDYRFCTDEHAHMNLDPMCQLHDYGTTPEESVDDIINQFYESLVLTGNRYDRYVAASTGYMSRAMRLQSLHRFYNEWRFKLADYLGSGKEYLENYTPEQYAQLLAKLENDPNFEGKDYLKVRRKIFDFFKSVTLLENKYCVALDKELGSLKAIELEKIRTQLRHRFPKAKIASCEDAEGIVKDFIESDGRLQYVGDVGFALNNYKFMLDGREAINEPIDVIGTFVDRVQAMFNIISRDGGVPGFLQKVFPNMLDEPDLFLEFEGLVLNRIVNGVELTDAIRKLGHQLPEDAALFAQNYEMERPVLLTLWSLLENGANNPYVNNSSRTTRYGRFVEQGSPALLEQVRKEGGQVLPLNSGQMLIIRRENIVSLFLVNKFYEVANTINTGALPVPTAAALKGGIVGGITPLVFQLPADASALTAEDYLAFSNAVMKFIEAQEDPYFVNLAFELLVPEIGVYLLALKPLTDRIEAGVAANEDVTEFQTQLNNLLAQMNQDMAGFFKQAEGALKQALGDPNYVAVIPSKAIGARITKEIDAKIKNIIETATLAKLDFESNQEEYISQANLLRSILVYDSGLSEYVGQILELAALNNADVNPGLVRIMNEDPRTYAEKLSAEAYVDRIMGTEKYSKLRGAYYERMRKLN
ncbi:MAG: zinc-dependent metalloprotease [Bdellovibrionaceae bacterium]|nr:zinc-dependent metalloprotease [Pseudobdellovibrionaceae bacterium]